MSKGTPHVSIKDLINATGDKKAASRIILEVEGRFYQATSVEPLEGDLVIIHAVAPVGIDWGPPRIKPVKNTGVPKALGKARREKQVGGTYSRGESYGLTGPTPDEESSNE